MPSRQNRFESHPRITITLVLLIVFVLINVLTRPLIPNSLTVPSPYYHHDFLPLAQTTLTWGNHPYPMSTNSLGFKDRGTRAVSLQSDRYRILFIGDSFTEGLGLAHEKTFVGLIEQEVEASRFDVLNAGVSSYSPRLYYLKVKHLIEEVGLRLDEVRVYIDISDVQDEVIYEDYVPRPLSTGQKLDHVLTRNVYLYYALRKSTKLFRAYDRFYQERGNWTHNTEAFESWGRQGLVLAQENMDKLFRLCSAHGTKMTIAVYPWPVQIEQKDSTAKPVVVWERFAGERDIAFVNYFPHFINETPAEEIMDLYFIKGDRHWNERGHALIARHAGLPHQSTENPIQ